MRIFRALFILVFTSAACAESVIVLCPISGMIDEGVAVVVQRAVEEARDLGAVALVFEVDTPGGRVDSAVKIATAIGEAHCHTLAYVTGMGAVSAGALISYACNDIVMTPGSVMGDAQPVIPSGQGMLPTGEKEVSFVRTKMRALAERGGKNADIAAAMVDSDIELRAKRDESGTYVIYEVGREAYGDDKADAVETASAPPSTQQLVQDIVKGLSGGIPLPIGGPEKPPAEGVSSKDDPPASESLVEPLEAETGTVVVVRHGKLLTLTPQDALKYGVIPAIVNSLDEALAEFGVAGAAIHKIEANWAEKFFRWVSGPTIAGLLLMLGIGGLYFEVKTPGFGVPGMIAAVCLALLFGSHYILGLTEVIDIILVISGVILILLEIFLIPGFGVAGVAGMCCLAAGLYLSFVDFTIPEFSWQFARLGEVFYSFTVAFSTLVLFVFATLKLLPHTPMYRHLVLANAQHAEDGYVVQTDEDCAAALGLKGSATSMLRPVGKGRFGSKTLMVVSRGDFIEPGTPIEIVEVEGNRYVVDRLKEMGA